MLKNPNQISFLTDFQAADPAVNHFVDAYLEHVTFAKRSRAKQHSVVELRVNCSAPRRQMVAAEASIATVYFMETHLTTKKNMNVMLVLWKHISLNKNN